MTLFGKKVLATYKASQVELEGGSNLEDNTPIYPLPILQAVRFYIGEMESRNGKEAEYNRKTFELIEEARKKLWSLKNKGIIAEDDPTPIIGNVLLTYGPSKQYIPVLMWGLEFKTKISESHISVTIPVQDATTVPGIGGTGGSYISSYITLRIWGDGSVYKTDDKTILTDDLTYTIEGTNSDNE